MRYIIIIIIVYTRHHHRVMFDAANNYYLSAAGVCETNFHWKYPMMMAFPMKKRTTILGMYEEFKINIIRRHHRYYQLLLLLSVNFLI